MWSVLLVTAGLGAESVFAEHAPISMRIGLRTGVEISSSVKLTSDPDRRTEALLLGLDVDAFSEQFLLGAGLAAAGGPFSHGALRGGVHTGIRHDLTTSVHTTATVGLGMQWFDHICPAIFRSEPCGSAVLPFVGLSGAVGYAGKHVEVSLWSAVLVDLGRKHVTSGNEYDIGGVTLGGGLTVAYLSRR